MFGRFTGRPASVSEASDEQMRRGTPHRRNCQQQQQLPSAGAEYGALAHSPLQSILPTDRQAVRAWHAGRTRHRDLYTQFTQCGLETQRLGTAVHCVSSKLERFSLIRPLQREHSPSQFLRKAQQWSSASWTLSDITASQCRWTNIAMYYGRVNSTMTALMSSTNLTSSSSII